MTTDNEDLEYVSDILQKFVSGTLDIGVAEALRLKSAYGRVKGNPFLVQRTLQKLVERDARIRDFVALAAAASPVARQKAAELGLL